MTALLRLRLGPQQAFDKTEMSLRPRCGLYIRFGASRLAVARRGMPNFLSSRRAPLVVFGGTRDNRAHYPVDVRGGGRNSQINRIMSANRRLGMASGAISPRLNAPHAARRGDGHLAHHGRDGLTILETPTLRARCTQRDNSDHSRRHHPPGSPRFSGSRS
jgi:hypothetical protein